MSRFSGLFIPDQKIELLDMRQDSRAEILDSIQEIDPHPILVETKGGWRTRAPQILGESTNSENNSKREQASGPVWIQFPRQIIFGTPVPRLCITVPAGVGKTTAVQQLEVLRPALNPGHLVLKLDLAELYTHEARSAISYLDLPNAENCLLVQRLYQEGNTDSSREQGTHLDFETVRQLIRSDIERQNFTLIVDALDQLSSQRASQVAVELNSFLQMYPKVNLVVAGRPYSITRLWRKLFEDQTWPGSTEGTLTDPTRVLDRREKKWYFARINKFSEGQIKRYLDPERFQLISQVEADSLFLPRTLNRIRCLTDEELEWVRTASDVYWLSVNATLLNDLRTTDRDSNVVAGTELDPQKLLPLLSALAFTAVAGGTEPETDFFSEGEKLDDYLDHAKQFYENGNMREPIDFQSGLRQLCELNLDAFSMVVDEFDQEHLIKFSDPTLRDFLAAHWVAKYVKPDDVSVRKFLRSNISYGKNRTTGRAYYDFWKFLGEMPGEFTRQQGAPNSLRRLKNARRKDAWSSAISVLFDTVTHSEHSIGLRPTEMMYRALPSLFALCSGANGQPLLPQDTWDEKTQTVLRWTEKDLQNACTEAQELARQLVSVPDSTEQPNQLRTIPQIPGGNSANAILLRFLTEFPLLYHGIQPNVRQKWRASSVEDYRNIIRNFNHDFREIPPKTVHQLEGWDPVSGEKKQLPNRFQLHHTVVTEAEYATFVQGNIPETRRTPQGATGDFPVVYVSWYDGFLFSFYAHGKLPSEREWEYAARAATNKFNEKVFYWWNVPGDSKEVGKRKALNHAWFGNIFDEKADSNSGNKIQPVAFKGNIIIDGKSTPFDSHNQFGLADMLGLVSEWTSNWYTENRSRVVRGGSFVNGAGSCTCSFRNDYNPATAFIFSGFRVARVPRKTLDT